MSELAWRTPVGAYTIGGIAKTGGARLSDLSLEPPVGGMEKDGVAKRSDGNLEDLSVKKFGLERRNSSEYLQYF